MKISPAVFTPIVSSYYPLLHRFARFIVKNDVAASHIANEALAFYWGHFSFLHSAEERRQFLHDRTRLIAHAWLYQEALTLKRV